MHKQHMKLALTYIECGFGQIMSLPRAEFDEWKRKLADSPIPCAAMNGMLPGQILRLTGPDADLKPVREFLSEAFERAGEIGLPVVVFGSGAAAQHTSGQVWQICSIRLTRRWYQVAEYLQMAGNHGAAILATRYLRVAVARHGEQHNTHSGRWRAHGAARGASERKSAGRRVPHGRDGRRRSGSARCGFGHAAPLPHGQSVGTRLSDGDDRWDYAPFFDALKQIGYQGGVSVEAGCSDFAQAAKRAFEVLDPLRK